MRNLIASAVLMLIALAAPSAGAAKEEFTGRATFRDGSVSTHTRRALGRHEMLLARDITEMKDHGGGRLKLQLPAVALALLHL